MPFRIFHPDDPDNPRWAVDHRVPPIWEPDPAEGRTAEDAASQGWLLMLLSPTWMSGAVAWRHRLDRLYRTQWWPPHSPGVGGIPSG